MEASDCVFKGAKPCKAIRYDAEDIPNKDYDLVYVDPPYLTRTGDNETSDYRRSYHLLEGLCNYEFWDKLIDYQTPNLRMKPTTNDWAEPEKNSKAFDVLFEKFRRSIMVVSYKKFGTPSIDTLLRMFKRHGRKVRSRSRHYVYALNHQNGSAELNREVLLIARNKELAMTESFTSQITVDKTIVSLLSKFTYERSFPYAVRELISNAYDADATEARIEIDLGKDRVTIHDNGTGMTREEFDFYLRIAGQRRGKRETQKFGRKRIGQFGVGFLAILPFCESLQITSTTENSEESFTADIPAWKFFRHDGKAIDVGEIEVTGEITRSAKTKTQHFTQINLVKLSDIAKRYFRQRALSDQKDRISSQPAMQRLKWEIQEDLPLSFAESSPLYSVLPYAEPIGMDVYFQNSKLYRNSAEGEVIDSGNLTIAGAKLRYAIVTPWKAVKPFELRGLKIRLNNVGIGPRQVFGVELGRKYSRLHWLSGEVQILGGLDSALTLSRDAFVATPEYEAVSEKLGSILRKWADYVETVDVAARDMTKQIRGGKQVAVASKRDVLDRNIRTLVDRGFAVRKVEKESNSQPVHVDRAKKEITVYEQHPDLEDTISIGGRKRRIVYVNSPSRISYENACRLNDKGELEIETQYPLFRSKRYGDIFKRIYIINVLAREKSSTPKEMYKFVLAQIDKEFRSF